MKYLIFYFFISVGVHGWGQNDTLNPLTSKQIADSVYGNLNSFISSQKLFNRLLLDDTTYSITWNTHHFIKDSVNYPASSDNIYGLIYELKNMSVDTSMVEDPFSVFKRAQELTGEIEFSQQKFIYPIGIIDYNYHYLDEQAEINSGNLSETNHVLSVNSSTLNLSMRNARLIAPVYDFFDSDSMGIVFRSDFFFSNYRSFSDIQSIKITHQSTVSYLLPDEIFFFKSIVDSIQKFEVELIYDSGDSIAHHFILQTPDLVKKQGETKSNSTFPECTEFLIDGADNIDIDGNQISWCMIPRCDYDGRLLKPFLLLTGYRPPMLEQSFNKTWQFYNDEHGELLQNLRANNYDVFLVRFNIHAKPFTHGMLESAVLLMKFIEGVNSAKNSAKGHENVLQGSSMSADIARLTLLTMEKKHLEDNSYPHHHSRLFISYDANFYGANLPMAYQYQIISHVKHPAINNFGIPGTLVYQGIKWALSLFLYSTLEQKTVKQLLQYHALATDPFLFTSPVTNLNIVPSIHPRRQEFYDALSLVDNGVHIFPMPLATRNISISLGKIKNLNSFDDSRFINAGESWRDINLLVWRFKLTAAKYTPAGSYANLYIRRKTGVSFTSPWNIPFVHHKINVSQMQEVDNVSGSYLPGSGNLIQVGNLAYFPLNAAVDAISGSDYQFTHKAVVTALGINLNLWPANGSMTLDLQSLGLMNVDKLPSGVLIQSSHFGYPNLGRPYDHFQVTPFEAIYVDNNINPHIRYEDPIDAPDVPFVNDFMLNEIEPWYLGLQNTRLGSTARTNYVYHSYRRAKHSIVVGYLVTPSTDPGDFAVEANGKLTLKAGDEINLKPGVHFKLGSNVHIVPDYEICNDLKNGHSDVSDHSATSDITNAIPQNRSNDAEFASELKLYPNPILQNLKIESSFTKEINEVCIFNLMGIELLRGNFKSHQVEIILESLHEGVYLVRIRFLDNSIITKQIQKL